MSIMDEQLEQLDAAPDPLPAYEQQGFERGYYQAVGDILATLVFATERYLRECPACNEAQVRQAIYDFEQFLNEQIRSVSKSHERGSVDPDPEYII